jgi:hypothetical protein
LKCALPIFCHNKICRSRTEILCHQAANNADF